MSILIVEKGIIATFVTMKRFLASTMVVLCLSVTAHSQTDYGLKFQRLIQSKLLKTSEIGISVYDLTADSMLYGYHNYKLYRPASVEKLITTITALARLGKDHSFNTSLAMTGTVRNDTLNGDLYVIGGFDPNFMSDEMNQLAKQVRANHIKYIKGKLYSDVSMVDSTLYYGNGWSWDDAMYDFQPTLSPLMFHKGWVTVTAYPGAKNGDPANIDVFPSSSYNVIDNRTVTGSKDSYDITRDYAHAKSKFIATGSVNSRKVNIITVADSKTFFVRSLIDRLKENGVATVAYGGNRETPVVADTFYTIKRPLKEVLKRAMKVSDNLNAESMFYHLAAYGKKGKYASAADAVKVIYQFIDELGMNHDDYKIVDGCGVSLYDYVSPDLLVAFLKYAYKHQEIRNVLYPALPIGGVDGTLKNRLENGNVRTNVHAKTGTVTGVSTLAGYLQTTQGHVLAFAIFNQNILKDWRAQNFQDRICRMLAE